MVVILTGISGDNMFKNIEKKLLSIYFSLAHNM